MPTGIPTTIGTDPKPPPPGTDTAAEPVQAQAEQSAKQEVLGKPRWNWKQYTQGRWQFVAKYPVQTLQDLPAGPPIEIPKLQHNFSKETAKARDVRLKRLEAVEESFSRSWAAYKKYAWMKDELRPVEAGSHQSFGGWAATLVDSLDSLWIMGLKEEFEEAVEAAKGIDFTKTETTTLNLFETTIRYLGGFLGAYDISDGKYREYIPNPILPDPISCARCTTTLNVLDTSSPHAQP